jgi:methylglutaconyl-CoA hydratase
VGNEPAALVNTLLELEGDAAVRVVGLRMAGGEAELPEADPRRLELLLRTVDGLAKPTVAVARGELVGAAVGLVAACDVALASREAGFAVRDVRSGRVPAVIAPYLIRAMGARQAGRYLLTGERLTAEEAHHLALVHAVLAADALDVEAERLVATLRSAEPAALAATKRAIRLVRTMPQEGSLFAEALLRLAEPPG